MRPVRRSKPWSELSPSAPTTQTIGLADPLVVVMIGAPEPENGVHHGVAMRSGWAVIRNMVIFVPVQPVVSPARLVNAIQVASGPTYAAGAVMILEFETFWVRRPPP